MERPDLLYSALGLRRADLVAFVGGGGKTAAILTLAEELSHRDWRVLVSTTTRVGPRISEAMPTVAMLGDEPPESLASTINETRRAFLYAARDSEGKFVGPDPWSIAALRERGLADILLVEADGARHMPLKAPGEHEPRRAAFTGLSWCAESLPLIPSHPRSLPPCLRTRPAVSRTFPTTPAWWRF
jgi:hypothetical protein